MVRVRSWLRGLIRLGVRGGKESRRFRCFFCMFGTSQRIPCRAKKCSKWERRSEGASLIASLEIGDEKSSLACGNS